MCAALDANRAHTHQRNRTRDAVVYMRYTYDLPESALRSTSEYITAAFVALIPIADENEGQRCTARLFLCRRYLSEMKPPHWLSRCSARDRCRRQLSLENCHFEGRYIKRDFNPSAMHGFRSTIHAPDVNNC